MGKVTLRDNYGDNGLRDREYKCHYVYKAEVILNSGEVEFKPNEKNVEAIIENEGYPNCFLMFNDREIPLDNFGASFWELGATHIFFGKSKDLIELFKQVIADIEKLT
jgi:hypothetical protein